MREKELETCTMLNESKLDQLMKRQNVVMNVMGM